MPMVGGKKYAYTKKGKAAAKKAHTASKEAHSFSPDFKAIDKPTQSKFKLKKTH